MEVSRMSFNATLSILGIYTFAPNIFDELVLPADVDRSTVIESILTECAELETLYPDADFLKLKIGNWSKKELSSWDKLNSIWSAELDLTNEYDYERKRTPNLKRQTTGQVIDTGSNNRTAGLTTTNSVSAYNSSNFENRDKSALTGTDNYVTGNTRSYNNYQETETGTDTITEKGHKTPISKLIKEASEIAIHNIYDYITESFKDNFCVLVY